MYEAADHSFKGTVEEGSFEGQEQEEEEERKKTIENLKGTVEEDARGETIVLIDVGKTFKQAAIRWYQDMQNYVKETKHSGKAYFFVAFLK